MTTISMGFYRSPITGRDNEGVEITLLTPLLPFRIFEDGSPFLIPLVEEAPFISKEKLWAQQLLLQDLLVEELATNSIELLQNGAVLITPERISELASFCRIESIAERVMERWTHDGDDGPMFLEKIGKNEYTLGPSHEKALVFLREQGQIRQRQHYRGKASAQRKQLKKGTI